MESAYWIARRYSIPFLLIVLNNGGWNAPKLSALLVHKNGLSSKSNRRGNKIQCCGHLSTLQHANRLFRVDLNISFEPSPDYPGIAAAAGKAWGATITEVGEVDSTLAEAVKIVQSGQCAVVEVRYLRNDS